MSDTISSKQKAPDSQDTTAPQHNTAPDAAHQPAEGSVDTPEIGGRNVAPRSTAEVSQVQPDRDITGGVKDATIAMGSRSVAVGGDVNESAIATGDGSAAASRGGIAISGHVGGDLRISMGNAQIHLPPLLQIALALITIGTLFLVAVQISNVYVTHRKPKVMTGPFFNVAVAELQVVDENGQPIHSDISAELYDQLESDFKSNDDDAPPYQIWPPEYTGRIEGETREERKKAAEARASEIKADIVLYGVVTQTGHLLEFAPEFYVGFDSFKDAEEIIGQHRLGEPLKPFEYGSETTYYPPLKRRLEALSQITIGLAHYKFRSFEDALRMFSDVKLNKGEGQEVVELLLGNANLLMASETEPDEYLIAASGHYDKALEISPDYARAKVGQGIVLQSMALGNQDALDFDRKIDMTLLDDAESAYKAALNLGVQHENADIRAKVQYGLGTIYIARAIALGQDVDSLEPAKAELMQVVQEYQNGNKRIKNLAGIAYEELAWIATVQGSSDLAIEYYQIATELVADRSKSRPFYRLGEMYSQAGQTELALESYAHCIDFSNRFDEEEYGKKCDEKEHLLNDLEVSVSRAQ